MTVHVRYISQVIVRLNFEGEYNPKMEKELDRCLKEQIENAIYFLINSLPVDCFVATKIRTG